MSILIAVEATAGNSTGAVLAALHRIGQCQLPIATVCAGLPQLASRLVEASSYAERLFSYHEMGKLSSEAVLRP